jgi:hypothetical protein
LEETVVLYKLILKKLFQRKVHSAFVKLTQRGSSAARAHAYGIFGNYPYTCLLAKFLIGLRKYI